MSLKFIPVFYSLFLIILQCEPFTGYDLDSEPPQARATLYGTVTNKFSSRPVFGATITLRDYRTQTDGHGEYLIQYVLNEDDIRNKPVQISISASNYLTFTDEFIIYPVPDEKNYTLEYAAPIIRRNVFVFSPTFMICQVLMVDYQGINTLNSVAGIFEYVDLVSKKRQKVANEMTFIEALSDTTAYYQAIVSHSLPGDWVLDLKQDYVVNASDQSGYSVSESRLYRGGQFADTLLFEPVIP